jgi:hypothetical protein
MELVTYATRVCKVMGIETMIGMQSSVFLKFKIFNNLWLLNDWFADSCYIVTNAAGGLNPDYAVGDIVILNDVRLK